VTASTKQIPARYTCDGRCDPMGCRGHAFEDFAGAEERLADEERATLDEPRRVVLWVRWPDRSEGPLAEDGTHAPSVRLARVFPNVRAAEEHAATLKAEGKILAHGWSNAAG